MTRRAVVAHQEPPREPRLHRMLGIAEGGAGGLHIHDLGIAQEHTMQRRALIHHLL